MGVDSMSLRKKVRELEEERDGYRREADDARREMREALRIAGEVARGRWVVLFASDKPEVCYGDDWVYWGAYPTVEAAKRASFSFFANDLRHLFYSGGPRMIYPAWAHIVRITPTGFAVLSEVYGERVDNETTWKWKDAEWREKET